MKLIPVCYYGFTAMDRRFSSPMLPWIVSEIRKREYREKLSLGVEDGHLQAYNADFEVQFAHRVSQMTRFSQADLDPCTFLYLLRDDVEQLLYCYLFQATVQSDVSELYQQMKEHSAPSPQQPVRSATSASNLTTLCDISPSSSNFFEVLYIGKIKVWHKKVPDTFIDDALAKFKQHDVDKQKKKLARLRSEMDLRRGSIDSIGSNSSGEITPYPKLQRSHSLLTNLSIKSPDVDRKVPHRITESASDNEEMEKPELEAKITEEEAEDDESDIARLEKELKLSSDKEDHNRTMVLQVDRTDLRLISPDRKVMLLHKQHRDVTTCLQGITSPQHFGFICRESNNMNTFIGYVFKCESASVSGETVAAIRQAYNNTDLKPSRPSIASCEHCPMVWFHKLCYEIENLTDRKTQAAIFRKIDQLDEEEQNLILTKYRGAESGPQREQNEFLMMLLRAHCEMKQGRHVHDSVENRSEFLNQYIGGGNTIFMKAKRSLSNSFDHLLKRRASKDDVMSAIRDMTLPVHSNTSRETSPNYNDTVYEVPEVESPGFRSRSNTLPVMELKDQCAALRDVLNKKNSPERCLTNGDKAPKSPMMDIFFKVGSSPKIGTEVPTSPKIDPGSWRQAIFKRVITPGKQPDEEERKRTPEELRALWKKSIHQAILLVRMERENARIRAKQEVSAVKRIKLEYDEMRTQNDATDLWDKDLKYSGDSSALREAVRQGIPRGKRGEAWQCIAEQYDSKLPPVDPNKYPNYTVLYETLLKQLTSHQHAILIDLGRTFPAHAYYSSPLGPGQLALFNLLKAYSLLDPEVGYCQGLSFVAGVLLLHMEESQAFYLLRHLMFRRGLRNQYLPDMVGLQIKLYQLSRLIHDELPELYDHLDAHEVAPTLYAAPWLLTVFASQFPLGFVTRVFDLIFLENTDVIFRVVLTLLTIHKDSLMACDSFEDVMNYLKNKLPAIDKDMLDRIMKEVCNSDLSKQLGEYSVEYMVLQEEIQSVQSQAEAFHKLEMQNRSIVDQNRALITQLELALANVQRLEKNRAVQQGTINKLETKTRTLEVTVATLGNFISNLIEDKVDVEIPGEIRRIISQLSLHQERRRSNSNNFLGMFKKQPNKIMVKSLSTGRLGINNNINEDKKGFFSNSHKDIIEQKLHGETIEDYDSVVSPTNSEDSGVGTPVSNEEHDSLNNNRDSVHPLSNCDINVTYNTRELKKVKSTRNMHQDAAVK